MSYFEVIVEIIVNNSSFTSIFGMLVCFLYIFVLLVSK